MNLLILSPVWLAWLFAGLMTAAAIQDAVQLKISNFICLGVLAAALVAMWLAGPEIALWQNFAVLVGLLIIGTPFFATGKMGGGDVKLLAAAGLWFDLRGALVMLLWVLIAGGLLAILVLVIRLFGWSESARDRVHLLKKGGGIPYGVAIAAGTMLAGSVMRSI
jgi:prepilin peptidase CpaA